ncbi:sialidase family protein [Sulfidibacter corallicola]|uniref:Exo-alpha-sialidase n=1 Tax=Sulfidibacter corallicola TaxID=2818388 RepID=A0A8A4TGG6_SULCO|nr:sialidase family protein [Sulfidibacter corallicola]QTD48650.1 exo-alpha-sialidase [Sulfidibacter corallicola]
MENVEPDDEVVGAVHVVVAHPTNADVLWVCAVNGGIWKTENATSPAPTWVSQTDSESGSLRSLSFGAMSLDPSDTGHQTLVAGTGRFSSFASTGGDRIGVLRTTDGGTTWTQLTGTGLQEPNISGIAARGNIIVISANGSASNLSNTFGVFRSTDTGATFSQVSLGDGGTTGLPGGQMMDLVGDPLNSARLFTASRLSDNDGGVNGIYRSDDTGATWTRVSNAAIESLIAAGASNIEMAVGQNNNVFAAICTNGRLSGLFRSGDGGDNWTQMDLPNPTIHPGGQASIHLSIAADPTNDQIVYIGGDRQDNPFPNSIGAIDFSGNLYRCDASAAGGSQCAHLTHDNSRGPEGGGTASNSSPHADSREMTFDAAGNLIETDDGGIYKRTDPRSDQGDWISLNGTLASTEFHNIAYDSNANVVVGGAQDTGSSAQDATGSQRWVSVQTADGGDVAVDDTTTPGLSVRYTSFQGLGQFRRETWNANNEFQSSVFIGLNVVSGQQIQPAFLTPIELHGVDQTRMIILANNGTFESFDQGDTLTQISTTVSSAATLGSDPISYGAADNENILYVGNSDTLHVRTGPPGSGLTQSTSFPGTGVGFSVRDIVLDPDAGNTAFALTGIGIFHTDNAGASWVEITGNLTSFDPGFHRSLAYRAHEEGDILYAGTDRGVFQARASDGFSVWRVAGTGLPNAPAMDLDYDPADGILTAGLMGRGAWTLPIPECRLDLTGDQVIDQNDFRVILADWRGTTYDIDENGSVDIRDLIFIFNNYGNCD